MHLAPALRRGLLYAVSVLASLLLLALAFAAIVDAGHLREPFVALLAMRTGHRIEIHGAFRPHIFSIHPQFVAERVTIGNPSWMPAGSLADIEKLSVELATPRLGQLFAVESLTLEGASLHLVRDDSGASNWQLEAPQTHSHGELPLIRGLSIPDARATLKDLRRHLSYEGSVSVRDGHITGGGTLNDAPVTFEVIGASLATASRTQPYHFRFEEHSDAAQVSGEGDLDHAYNFDQLHTRFDSRGENLKALYQLAGVSLINSGRYHLSGDLTRNGRTTTFSELQLRTGESDLSGSVTIETTKGRSSLTASLNSEFLRTIDLGERAARGDSNPMPASLMFSDAAISPDSVRRGDAIVDYHAHRAQLGRVPLQAVAGKLLINRGILNVEPLSADTLGGTLNASLRMDATSDDPRSTVEIQLKGIQIGMLDHHATGQPRIEAPLDAHIRVTGHGGSVHQIAASADGTVEALLAQGTIRSSLAELSAGDLRGFGMLLGKSDQESSLRCGRASFLAHAGTLTARRLTLDTDQVQIQGEGEIDLRSEQLRLSFTGSPKVVRLLRVNAPVSLGGTLQQPKFALAGARSMKLIDRGKTQDVDCAALLR